MKNNISKLLLACGLSLATVTSCSSYLDVDPKNKIPGDVVLTDPNGVKAFLANLYYQAPIEDHVYFPREGFNARGNTGFLSLAQYGMEAIHSEWPNWNEYKNDWWEKGYKLNRSINILLEAIPSLSIAQSEKDFLMGEAYFLRAYTYFGLAKCYGGVPLIDKNQEYTTDFESLKVSRKTEKETWDFVLASCDEAIAKLPENHGNTDASKRRATKWAAYALKSRAALHAASVAKYWQQAPLSGEAVTQKLVGLASIEAAQYYRACIEASEKIMESGRFSLHKANPATREEAIKAYQEIFYNPASANEEAIFLKGYGQVGNNISHDLDGWNGPNQTSEGFPHRGRTNPILELVDLYEEYDRPGEISPIITTTDGNISGTEGYNPSVSYRHFDHPEDIFAGRDARFFASVIYPNAMWKGQQIVIQGGVVRTDGSLMDSRGSYTHNAVTYYTYGKEQPNQYSGFDGSADMTRSGFLMRKFLNEGGRYNTWLQSTTDFIDMRYAEVLLNYAEAVLESGMDENGAQIKAKEALNAIRVRAGHRVAVPLTLTNVLRERTVELAFENKGYWDLIRRRTFHTVFKNKIKQALIPMMDLRGSTPQYIFVRKNVPGAQVQNFPERDYYRPIPNVAGNGAIQNPQH
ncbi:RagB/SusD family nutrient uptake outer membrane protein [Sphingobacterium faecale]|uniref:RagB/SusD family nutrient uptake outer membrane protein n=1 Tax=Sphingobacterium faecale TaxID=2803775 RepID=A0ABS1R9E5_9SPHI|nr:RagB/SusD family nutrient uptake outer membrane protein [Sphingobacterium faecale]MBL1410441.1 RagB/SusD family nutrient uptake outer membrane protein [Sphingobacterium faecale]